MLDSRAGRPPGRRIGVWMMLAVLVTWTMVLVSAVVRFNTKAQFLMRVEDSGSVAIGPVPPDWLYEIGGPWLRDGFYDVRILTISMDHATAKGGRIDLRMLRMFPKMSWLDLRGDDVTAADLAIVGDQRQLHVVTIQDAPMLTDADLTPLARLTALTYIKLTRVPITDAGLRFLKPLTRLTEMTLTHTRVTGSGLAYLIPSRVRRLDLSGSAVDDAGLATIARLTNLDELDLSNTRVTDAGLVHLAGLTKLRSLRLYRLKITDAGMASVAKLRSLEVLDVSATKITDAGLEPLKSMTHLNGLTTDETAVTDAALMRFAKEHPAK